MVPGTDISIAYFRYKTGEIYKREGRDGEGVEGFYGKSTVEVRRGPNEEKGREILGQDSTGGSLLFVRTCKSHDVTFS